MTIQLQRNDLITYLQRFLTHNKARGMVAEMTLDSELNLTGTSAESKLLSGGWLISPNVVELHRYRYIVFSLSALYENPLEVNQAAKALEKDRAWQSLATFLSHSGFGIIVTGGWSTSLFNDLKWKHYIYRDENLQETLNDEPFSKWTGTRGRASPGAHWDEDVLERFNLVDIVQLNALVMRQAFFYGYLKEQLHKPLGDPYDIDAFVVGFSGAVMPVEVKEKSRTTKGEFGIDAGRILMLLRLCIASDSNAFYLIREIADSPGRPLIGWKYATLSDIVMGAKWNLQGGGRGMTGGATQTVMLSGSLFNDLTTYQFSENWLSEHASLQASVKLTARQLTLNLPDYL